ncbi:beta-lactamase family protein [Chitinophagaceae bacterium LB-8]|uniref:Beta-lactamase family protein n=1 Tax=Paraflavisolibacter caeni TaxID=2982496 RepID=A0A9X2XPL8_9BACT|nr:serine hydrolase [Paraflavisolibacter caeni]MCU7551234.1 beta-lactamase family protein [Paraflavisolibacter caeni]
MRKILAFSLLILFLSSQAQTSVKDWQLPSASPASMGVSVERLSQIDRVLQEYVDKQWISGATALVMKDGKIIYHKSIGYNDLETKTPLAKDAIYRIASQTKAITSVGVMMLYEQGKLLLDDPVSKYIPEFKNPKVLDKYNEGDTTYTTIPAKKEISIRELLTHTSGIGYAQIGNPKMNAIYAKAGVVGGIGVADTMVLGNKIKILAGLPLFHQPGEQWTYGLNTDVLGYLIEVVSGMSLDQFFRTRIFEPLGMKDTYFYLPSSKRARLVTLYTESKDSDKKLQKAPAVYKLNGNFYTDYPAHNGSYYSGGVGLSSTAYDYALFMQMLLNGGSLNGKRILSKAAIRMMTSNQIGQISFHSGNYFGLGFEVVSEANSGKSSLSPGSFFWGGMFSSTYWIDPKEKIVAQLFLNKYPNSQADIHEKFKALVYAALTE